MSGEIFVSRNEEEINSNYVNFNERQEQLKEQEKKEKEAFERAKKSPYNNFLQVNNDKNIQKAKRKLLMDNPNAYLILEFLMANMDGTNAIMCSYKVFEELLDLKRTTAFRAIKLLKERSFIEIHKSGTSNVYCVNSSIAWKSWGQNIKHAKFNASIILSETEQDEIKIKTESIKNIQTK